MKKIVIVTGLLLLTGPAYAQSQPPTKFGVDFAAPLLDVTGQVMKDDSGRTRQEIEADPKCDKCKTITLGTVVARCLVTDDKAPAEQKPAYWALARRIIDAKDAKLDATEIHVITQCVERLPPTVAGQVDPLIDPNFTPAPLK